MLNAVDDMSETNPVCSRDASCTAIVAGEDDGVCVPPDPEDVDGGSVTSP
jgi:hypothetical protein